MKQNWRKNATVTSCRDNPDTFKTNKIILLIIFLPFYCVLTNLYVAFFT